MATDIMEWVNGLHARHVDNAMCRYIAECRLGRSSVGPQLRLLLDYFLFDQLCRVHWQRSLSEGQLVFHGEDRTEKELQNTLLEYLASDWRQNPDHLRRVFAALASWRCIKNDQESVQGNAGRFQEEYADLHRQVIALSKAVASPDDALAAVKGCLNHVRAARGGIVQGRRNSMDVHDGAPWQYAGLIEAFLRSLTSAFFASLGKTPLGSDLLVVPLLSRVLGEQPGNEVILQPDTALTAIRRGLMKQEDTRLILEFVDRFPPPDRLPRENMALFYPGAGKDLLTPLLLGLPYCTEFHFHERSARQPPRIHDLLAGLPGIEGIGARRTPGMGWRRENGVDTLEFGYRGHRRRIFWVHADNLEFLDSGAALGFYFHRGDSPGEGGSGQAWDSTLLPRLAERIPEGRTCMVLTDGEPGGLDSDRLLVCEPIRTSWDETQILYHAGIMARYVNP